MDEPNFSGGTSSTDLPSIPVRSELASKGSNIGAQLQRQFADIQNLSRDLDEVLHFAADEGTKVERIAADLGMSVDLVDYVTRGGSTWSWFLNRSLHDFDDESERRHG